MKKLPKPVRRGRSYDFLPDLRYSEGRRMPPIVQQLLSTVEQGEALDTQHLRQHLRSLPHIAQRRNSNA